MQGLLRKLGAGFDDLMPGMASSSQFKVDAVMHEHSALCSSVREARVVDTVLGLQRILAQLRQEDNEVQHIDALGQLCELLSVSTEDSLSMLPVEALAPMLVRYPSWRAVTVRPQPTSYTLHASLA